MTSPYKPTDNKLAMKEYRELKHHIGALYKYTLGNVIEMRKNHDYRVEFTACGYPMQLDIIIGSEYPHVCPIFFLSPKPDHHWMHSKTNQVAYSPNIKFYHYWKNVSNYFVLAQLVEEIILGMKQHYLRNITIREAATTEDLCFLPIYSSRLYCFNKYTLPEIAEIFVNNGIFKRVADVPIDKFDEYVGRSIIVKKKLEGLMRTGKLGGLKETVIKSLMDQMQQRLDEDMNCRTHYDNYLELIKLYDVATFRQFLHEAVARDHADYNMIAKAFLTGDVTAEIFTMMFRNLSIMMELPAKEHQFNVYEDRSKKCLQM